VRLAFGQVDDRYETAGCAGDSPTTNRIRGTGRDLAGGLWVDVAARDADRAFPEQYPDPLGVDRGAEPEGDEAPRLRG
jgi:hypothetical protein